MAEGFDNDFMPAVTAMRYLGIDDLDELERVVVDHDVDVELDGNGLIRAVEMTTLKNALFEEHRRVVGYRPDDPIVGAQNRARIENEREARRVARLQRRGTLERRVAYRRAMKEQG